MLPSSAPGLGDPGLWVPASLAALELMLAPKGQRSRGVGSTSLVLSVLTDCCVTSVTGLAEPHPPCVPGAHGAEACPRLILGSLWPELSCDLRTLGQGSSHGNPQDTLGGCG